MRHVRRVIALPDGQIDDPGDAQFIASDDATRYEVRLEPKANHVMLRLTTPYGPHYTFALSRDIAADISDRLRIESAESNHVG